MTVQIEPDATVGIAAQPAEQSQQRSSVRDSLRFLKLWLRRPASFGAVLPSGKSLARAMAAQVDPAAPGAVVELGGGTGSITAALLASGTAREDLVVIEREPDLVDLLRARFRGLRVIGGDARETADLLDETGIGPVKAVVSGLPLLSLPAPACRDIVSQAFVVLEATGVLVQFTYGPLSPVPQDLARRLDIAGDRADWVLDNVPPASVWNYRRRAC